MLNMKVQVEQKLNSERLTDNMKREMRSCFDFFWNECNTEEGPGYGLIRDRYPSQPKVASIASCGFGLAAWAYGVHKNFISFAEGAERAEKAVRNYLTLKQKHGFLQHFYNMQTGDGGKSEFSTIDTAILLCGAVVAKNFFGGEVARLCEDLLERTEWDFIVDKNTNIFHMAFFENEKFFAYWDGYSEQLMMYTLGRMSKSHTIDKKVYYAFERPVGGYGDYTFCYSVVGALFTHQFSHAFIDFRDRTDEKGMNWFDNSILATKAARSFCIDESKKHPTYGENSWGLTACDVMSGYKGNHGSPPCGGNNTFGQSVGVIPPAGALGSFPFTPELCSDALDYYYSLEKLTGRYGLLDSFSTERDWYAKDVIGIDKGISLLMMANYESDFVWKYFDLDKAASRAMDGLGLIKQR